MMRVRTVRGWPGFRAWVIAAALVLSAPAGLAAPHAAQRDTRAWYQAYSDGVRAINARNWQGAIDSLLAAKKAGPRSGRNIPSYGDNIIDFYSPDYYLGVAYLNLQRFAEADAAFRQVRQSDLILPKDREFAAFNAQASRASFELRFAEAENQLAQGQLSAAREALLQAKGLGVELDRVNRLELRITKAELDAAELAKKEKPPVNPPPTDPPATDPAKNPPPLPPPTNPDINPTGGTRGAPSGSGTDVNIRRPGTRENNPSLSPGPAGGSTQITSAAAEAIAMELFFSGDYGGAAAALTPLANAKDPSPAASFYLACSKAALVLTGQADRGVLEDARALFARAGGSSRFSEDRKFISPRILQLLEGKQ